jgi:hypothetical protein
VAALSRKEIQRRLEELAQRLGAKVIYDDLNFPGGSCRGREQFYIIINDRLSLDEKVRHLCAGVSKLPWEKEELPPEIQNLLVRKPTPEP